MFVDYSLLQFSCFRKASFLENSFDLIMAGFAGRSNILKLDISMSLETETTTFTADSKQRV